MAQPLHALASPKVKWIWNEGHQLAFDALKKALVDPPILAHPDFNQEFLLQPISFASRTLSPTEMRYSTRRASLHNPK